MNPLRLLKKCVTDPPAAAQSARVALRLVSGQFHWLFKPQAPLAYHLPGGGVLLLDQKHSFTGMVWPNTESFEPDVCGVLQKFLKPGDTFIDGGANVGYFSVQAGHIVGSEGKVVSIEANPLTFQLLERNLEANGFGTPVHCALTSQRGEVELFMPYYWDVVSSLRQDSYVVTDEMQSFKVKGRTLDEVVGDLALLKIDMIKIDIEGAELDVLRSAPAVLSRFRPMIIMEYGVKTWAAFGATHEEFLELLERHKYAVRLFNPRSRELENIPEDIWQNAYTNLILIPKERIE